MVGPVFYAYRASASTGSYTFEQLVERKSSTYSETRVAAGPSRWGYSVHQEAGVNNLSWVLGYLAQAPILVKAMDQAPAAVVMDGKGVLHVAFVRHPVGQPLGTLHYTSLNGQTTSQPVEVDLVNQPLVVASSVDMTLDEQLQPIVTFVHQGQGLMAYRLVAGTWSLYSLASAGAGTTTRSQARSGNLHVVFDEGSALSYLDCQLP